jgi:hypothetical protein
MTAPGKTETRTYPYPQMDHESAILKVEIVGDFTGVWQEGVGAND